MMIITILISILLAFASRHQLVGVDSAKGKLEPTSNWIEQQQQQQQQQQLLVGNNKSSAGRNYDHGVLSVNITVTDAPKLVGLLDELNIPEGTNATITCSVGSGNLNGLTYEWYKDDELLHHSGVSNKIRIDIPADNYQSSLRVFNLEPSDAALYSCVAKNRFGQDKIATKLNVKVQLKWISEPKGSINVSAGKPLHVPCSAIGKPAAQIEWTKLADENQGVRSRSYGSELHFGAVSQEDSGLYECRAKNGVEEDLVSQIELKVLGK